MTSGQNLRQHPYILIKGMNSYWTTGSVTLSVYTLIGSSKYFVEIAMPLSILLRGLLDKLIYWLWNITINYNHVYNLKHDPLMSSDFYQPLNSCRKCVMQISFILTEATSLHYFVRYHIHCRILLHPSVNHVLISYVSSLYKRNCPMVAKYYISISECTDRSYVMAFHYDTNGIDSTSALWDVTKRCKTWSLVRKLCTRNYRVSDAQKLQFCSNFKGA